MVERSVGTALTRLVGQGVLTEEQRTAVLEAVARERSARASGGRWVAEVAAYAGAGLLLGGIVLLLGSSWEGLDRAAQVTALALVTVVLVAGGLALAGGPRALFPWAGRQATASGQVVPGGPGGVGTGGPDPGGLGGAVATVSGGAGPAVSSGSSVPGAAAHTVPMRLAAALFALTSISVAVLVGTSVDDGGNDTAWTWAATAGAIVAVLAYAALPSLLGLLAIAGFGNAAVAAILDQVSGNGTAIGLGIVVVGAVWFAATRFGFAEPAWAGYAVAIVTALAGAQGVLAEDRMWPGYLLGVLVALVCFALYRRQNHPVLVIGGGIALAVAVSEAVWDWTNGSRSAFVVVLIAGAILLVVGAAVLVRGRD